MTGEHMAIVHHAPSAFVDDNAQPAGGLSLRPEAIDALAEAVAERVARFSAASSVSEPVAYETPAAFGRRYNRSAKWVRARAAKLGAIREGSGTGSRYLIPVAAGDAAMQLLLVAAHRDETAGLRTAKAHSDARARAKRAKSRSGNELLPLRPQLPLK
jgi:hypothetical protein